MALASLPGMRLQSLLGAPAMRGTILYFSHHRRFITALLLGLVAFGVSYLLGRPQSAALQIIIAGDVFFVLYLGLTAGYVRRTTAPELRARAANPDEGLPLILLVTAATVAISLASVFLLVEGGGSGRRPRPAARRRCRPAWLADDPCDGRIPLRKSLLRAGGGWRCRRAEFPKTPEPGLWDFLYYAYVVGMTAQVSDVAVSREEQRRVTLVHGIFSFFYNTVILALAVNAAANLRG